MFLDYLLFVVSEKPTDVILYKYTFKIIVSIAYTLKADSLLVD